MLIGIIPRAGPGRALSLATSSLRIVHALPNSFSKSTEVFQPDATRALRGLLRTASNDHYIAVTGEKGVGKSMVLEMALRRNCGVVTVEVSTTDTSQEKIVARALAEIADIRESFVDPLPSARRVLWWYGLLLPRPIVLMRAGEPMQGQKNLNLPAAALELTGYGLRVVIDDATNSLTFDAALTADRLTVLDVEPMPLSTLRSIPQYVDVFTMLRKEGLEDVAYLVHGGIPAAYDNLKTHMACALPADHRDVAVTFIRSLLGRQMTRLGDMLCRHPVMKTVVSEFLTKSEVPASMLIERGILENPSPHVLRVVLRDNCVRMLVPASSAMALVLRHDFDTTPSIEELEKLCSKSGDDKKEQESTIIGV